FQLPVVFGIWGSEPSELLTILFFTLLCGFFGLLGCDNSTVQFFRYLDAWLVSDALNIGGESEVRNIILLGNSMVFSTDMDSKFGKERISLPNSGFLM
ncbi:hypothetical protein RhiirA4_483742, partial [Rhizophagus irregularis]